MGSSELSLDIEVSWRMREQEARLLADLLRTSRLTLLFGDAGTARTDLLEFGVLPLLSRRAEDGAPVGEPPDGTIVLSLPDRRERSNGSLSAQRERVVAFDAWSPAPLAALQTAILSTLPLDMVTRAGNEKLPEMLAGLCERLDNRFIVILDRFEQFWAACSNEQGVDDFIDQFSQAVNRADLRVNFLLSIDQDFEGCLHPLRTRIAGFDDSTLRLHDWQGLAPALPVDAVSAPLGPAHVSRQDFPDIATIPVLLEAVTGLSDLAVRPPEGRPLDAAKPTSGPRKRPPRVPAPKPAPIGTDGVYAFIESTLSQTADASEPWHDTAAAPAAAYRSAVTAGDGLRMTSSPAASMTASTPKLPEWWIAARGTNDSQRRAQALVEPPSPIDQWLDAVFSWCRRLLRMH